MQGWFDNTCVHRDMNEEMNLHVVFIKRRHFVSYKPVYFGVDLLSMIGTT